MNYEDDNHLLNVSSHYGKKLIFNEESKCYIYFSSCSMIGDNKIKLGLFTIFNNIYNIKSMLNSFLVN